MALSELLLKVLSGKERGYVMIKELLEQQVFMYVMLGIMGAGFLLRAAISIGAGRMLAASRHMADTESKLFKMMRLKFEACYKLKISIRNVGAFVDKYITGHKIFGMTLSGWTGLASVLAFLCVCVGISGTLLGIMEECSLNLVLEHFGMGLLCGAFLYVAEALSGLDDKDEQMRANAIDYFDNFLRARMEQEYMNSDEQSSYHDGYDGESGHEETVNIAQKKKTRAVSGEAKAANPAPVPVKKRRQPQMYAISEEEVAAAQELEEETGSAYTEQSMIARSIEEVEKEKIIEDILKEYLV